MVLDDLMKELEHLQIQDFKKVTKEQRTALHEKYNAFMSDLQYSKDAYTVKFISGVETYNKLQYYAGLEYDKEHMEYNLLYDNTVVVAYSKDSTNAVKLYELLESTE